MKRAPANQPKHAAQRDYRALHEGLSPPRIIQETVRTHEPIVAVLGFAPEFRYWKLVPKRGTAVQDLYRHHNLEQARKRAGLISAIIPCRPWIPTVASRMPRWAVTSRGELVVLNQRYLRVTDRGIEDREQGEARKLGPHDGPPKPRYLVSLGPLPEIRWIDAHGRLHKHEFFASLPRAIAQALMPILAHDDQGNLHVVRQGNIHVHPDGTIEETMKTRVPHANPAPRSKEIVRASSSHPVRAPHRATQRRVSTTVYDVTASPIEMPSREASVDIAKALIAGAAGVIGSAMVLRRTSLSTTERASATAGALGLSAFLLRKAAPNVALGLGIGGFSAASMPLFDSARIAVAQSMGTQSQGSSSSSSSSTT